MQVHVLDGNGGQNQFTIPPVPLPQLQQFQEMFGTQPSFNSVSSAVISDDGVVVFRHGTWEGHHQQQQPPILFTVIFNLASLAQGYIHLAGFFQHVLASGAFVVAQRNNEILVRLFFVPFSFSFSLCFVLNFLLDFFTGL